MLTEFSGLILGAKSSMMIKSQVGFLRREGLTAGEVRGVVGVGQEQVVGLGHPEVHHLGCVLQSPHCVLVHHVLQTHSVHLTGNNKQGHSVMMANSKSWSTA